MRGRKPRPIEIAPEDLPVLQQIAQSQTRPWYQVRRARILLGIAEGGRIQTLAFQTQCNESTVRRTCHRYERLGLSDLLDSPPRSGRPIAISPLQHAQIVELACLEPVAEGLHITHWTSEDLARHAVTDGIVPAISRGPSAGSCTTSTCNPTGPATGGQLAWIPSLSSGPSRSFGATATPTAWPSGVIGWSAPMRCPTIRSWNATRSGIRSLARSNSGSSSTPGMGRSTS